MVHFYCKWYSRSKLGLHRKDVVMKPKMGKRRNLRQVCFVPVDGKVGTGFGNSQTVDISKGGIGLISRKPVTLDEKIAIELELVPDQDPVLVMGQVRWIRRIPESGNYRMGVKFAKALLKGSIPNGR